MSLSMPGRHTSGRAVLFHLFLTSTLLGNAVNFMTWPLYPQKEPQCPLNRKRLRELRSHSGRSGDKKKSYFCQDAIFRSPSPSLVISTRVPRFQECHFQRNVVVVIVVNIVVVVVVVVVVNVVVDIVFVVVTEE